MTIDTNDFLRETQLLRAAVHAELHAYAYPSEENYDVAAGAWKDYNQHIWVQRYAE